MVVLAVLALIVSTLVGLALTVTLFGAPIGVPLLVLSVRSLLHIRDPKRRASSALLLISVAVLDLIIGGFAGYQVVLANEESLEARITVATPLVAQQFSWPPLCGYKEAHQANSPRRPLWICSRSCLLAETSIGQN